MQEVLFRSSNHNETTEDEDYMYKRYHIFVDSTHLPLVCSTFILYKLAMFITQIIQ